MPEKYCMTDRQRELLAYIRSEITHTGQSPTYESMMTHLGLKSKSGVHRLVDGLVQRGLIRRIPHAARSIALVSGFDGADFNDALRTVICQGHWSPATLSELAQAIKK